MADETIVIAEVGENHLGNMDIARAMVREAADAGADIVKFQSYLGSEVRPDDPERDWFASVELSDDNHRELKALAESTGIEFMSTPFTVGRARFLCEELGLDKIKIASSELTNQSLLDYVDSHANTVFLSTGMATLQEVRIAVNRVSHVQQLYILHCTTQYPCEDNDANLQAITTLKRTFPEHRVGLSDHTIGTIASLAAVAMGARVIEKHFSLGKSLPGTDHVLSVTPPELAKLVSSLRRLELMLGREEKAPVAKEREITDFVRSRFAQR